MPLADGGGGSCHYVEPPLWKQALALVLIALVLAAIRRWDLG